MPHPERPQPACGLSSACRQPVPGVAVEWLRQYVFVVCPRANLCGLPTGRSYSWGLTPCLRCVARVTSASFPEVAHDPMPLPRSCAFRIAPRGGCACPCQRVAAGEVPRRRPSLVQGVGGRAYPGCSPSVFTVARMALAACVPVAGRCLVAPAQADAQARRGDAGVLRRSLLSCGLNHGCRLRRDGCRSERGRGGVSAFGVPVHRPHLS